jgi:hypothetical protein
LKLSEFEDEKAIAVVAKLLAPIGRIVQNANVVKAKNTTPLEFAGALLENNAADVKTMLAILDDKDPADYHCTAATVFVDVLNMLNDPALMQLFGVQSKTPASAGSASESTEAQNN